MSDIERGIFNVLSAGHERRDRPTRRRVSTGALAFAMDSHREETTETQTDHECGKDDEKRYRKLMEWLGLLARSLDLVGLWHPAKSALGRRGAMTQIKAGAVCALRACDTSVRSAAVCLGV